MSNSSGDNSFFVYLFFLFTFFSFIFVFYLFLDDYFPLKFVVLFYYLFQIFLINFLKFALLLSLF